MRLLGSLLGDKSESAAAVCEDASVTRIAFAVENFKVRDQKDEDEVVVLPAEVDAELKMETEPLPLLF